MVENELFIAHLKQAEDMAKKLGRMIHVNVEYKEYKERLYLFEIKWDSWGNAHASSFPSEWWREFRRHGFRMMHLEVDYIEHKILFRIGYSAYQLVVISE